MTIAILENGKKFLYLKSFLKYQLKLMPVQRKLR
tara:strand:+ start:10765 stop:10866 length:102 start_codon:yes stop_codon:yes gene_type:complete